MEGGGKGVPASATTITSHHSRRPRSPTESSDFVDGSERKAKVSSNGTNFGPVPSQIEVQNAISELRRMMDGLCKTNSDINGVGQKMEQCSYDSSRTLLSSLGEKRLLDAYHLLQTDASVQSLVSSISSDPEVWDAIMKNTAVRDLPGFMPHTATEDKTKSYGQELDSATLIVRSIFAFMGSRIREWIAILEVFVLEKLQSMFKKGNPTSPLDLLEEKVRSSLLLSVIILLVIVVTRSMEGIIDL